MNDKKELTDFEIELNFMPINFSQMRVRGRHSKIQDDCLLRSQDV